MASGNTRDQHTIRDERPGNFFIVDNVVIDTYLPVIGATTFAVYAYLARRAGEKHATFPSITRVAKDLGLSPATVSRSLGVLAGNVIKTDNKREAFSLLAEAGLAPLIAIEPRYNDAGDKTTSNYVLLRIVSPVRGGHLTSEGTVTSPVRGRSPHQWGGEEDTGKKTQEEENTSYSDDDDSRQKTNTTAYGILAAWCDLVGIDPKTIANRAKEMRHATELAKTGMQAHHVEEFYNWLAGQSWRTGAVTLALMVNQVNNYRAYHREQQKPQRFIV